MGEINWTNEALEWLHKIYDYINEESPQSALKVIAGIYEEAQILKHFPELGCQYDLLPKLHIRILLYGHYRIVYLIKKKNDIDILGVFHEAMDIKNYL